MIKFSCYSWTLPHYNHLFVCYVAVPLVFVAMAWAHNYLTYRFFFLSSDMVSSIILQGLLLIVEFPQTTLNAMQIPTLLIRGFSASDFIGCCQFRVMQKLK